MHMYIYMRIAITFQMQIALTAEAAATPAADPSADPQPTDKNATGINGAHNGYRKPHKKILRWSFKLFFKR